MLQVVLNQKEVDRLQWAQFVANHPNGNIFHTPEMFDLHYGTAKYEPLFVSAFNSDKKIVGILIAYVHTEYTGFIGQYTARSIIWGGPLVTGQNTEIAASMLTEYNNVCRKKAIYSQFRNLWDISYFKYTFEQKGYQYEEHLNFLFDLNKNEEILWNSIHPTRRKQINRAVKREVQIRVADQISEKELESCYSILEKVYKSAKLPLPDMGFFRKAIRVLGNHAYLRAILASFQGEIIGFRFFLCYHGILYDWYAGSLSEHSDKYPNDILPWELMKWGVSNGFKTFDFGGAGKPDTPYGVRDYKMKFGGDLVNFGRYEKVNKPIAMALARRGFSLWKLLKK